MLIKNFFKKLFSRYNCFHFLNFGLFIICTIFSIYDISSHIKNYYKYRVLVNTKLDFDPQIHMPSITVCVPTIINMTQLKLNFPDVFEKIQIYNKKHKQDLEHFEWRYILADHLTIGQIKTITANFKEIFISCMFRTNDDKYLDCDRLTPIQQHFSLNHNCYVFFEQRVEEHSTKVNQLNFNPETEFDYTKINQTEKQTLFNKRANLLRNNTLYEQYFLYDAKKIKNKDWVRIILNKDVLWNTWIDFGMSFKGRFYEMYHGQPQFMCISSEVVTSVEFTFSITDIFRLPPPYESNCLDYKALGNSNLFLNIFILKILKILNFQNIFKIFSIRLCGSKSLCRDLLC